MSDIGIKKICVSVSNLDESIGFFTKEMGLSPVSRGRLDESAVREIYEIVGSSAQYAMLKNELQPTLLQLIEFSGTPKKSIREGRPSWDYGYYDMAFRAKNNYSEFEYFRNKKFKYFCPPTRYVADWINLDVLEAVLQGPDCIPIALIERLREPIPKFDGRFSIFTDCAITVEDGNIATEFYVDVLGLKKVFDEPLPDGLVDDIVSVPHGTHTRMLMYAGGNTPITECLEYSKKGVPMSDIAGPENVGIFAVAYETAEMNELLARASAHGFQTIRGPVRAVLEPFGEVELAYISGPSGILVEVYQPL